LDDARLIDFAFSDLSLGPGGKSVLRPDGMSQMKLKP